jgi:geranylgeranyl pyrophosphate synthase
MKLLSRISNSTVTILITDAVHNLNFGQFILSASNEELLANMNLNKWLELMNLVNAFSFKKGCESIAELINTDVEVKMLASEFGLNFALALQASTELDQLKKFINLNNQTAYLAKQYLSQEVNFSSNDDNKNDYSYNDHCQQKSHHQSNDLIKTSSSNTTHPILSLSSTYCDLFQLPIILDCNNLPNLIRKSSTIDLKANALKPKISYELLKDHLNEDNSFPKTMQFIQLYANKSIQCLDSLFSQTNLETNDELKDFIYTCLSFNKKSF